MKLTVLALGIVLVLHQVAQSSGRALGSKYDAQYWNTRRPPPYFPVNQAKRALLYRDLSSLLDPYQDQDQQDQGQVQDSLDEGFDAAKARRVYRILPGLADRIFCILGRGVTGILQGPVRDLAEMPVNLMCESVGMR